MSGEAQLMAAALAMMRAPHWLSAARRGGDPWVGINAVGPGAGDDNQNHGGLTSCKFDYESL